MQFTIGDKLCENTSMIKIKHEKEKCLWAPGRIRSDGIWCNLQMWTFLRATTGPEYSSPERTKLESIPVHLVQVQWKILRHRVHLLFVSVPASFWSSFSFLSNLCILWLQLMYAAAWHTNVKNQLAKVKRKERPTKPYIPMTQQGLW